MLDFGFEFIPHLFKGVFLEQRFSCLLDLIVRDWQKMFLKFSLEETIQLLGLEYSINFENQRERNPPMGKIEHIRFREFKYRVIIVNFSSEKVT